MVSIGSEHEMGQCNHEEADSRIMVQVAYPSLQGVLVRTVDTDVVVILVGKLHELHVPKYGWRLAWDATIRLSAST